MKLLFGFIYVLNALLLGANLAAQTTSSVRGADERFKADILVVVAHPDDEGAVTPYLARAIYDLHKRVAVVYGTHTASMGTGFLVNRSLVDLFEIEGSGLQLKDVENVDKQDDGAARRVYHLVALTATTILENGVRRIRDGFIGLFVYLFVLGGSNQFDKS